MSAHLIDIIRGALVGDVVQYHSPEWVARARAAVAAQPVLQPAFYGFMDESENRVNLCFTPDHPRHDGVYATAYYTAPVAAPVAMPAASVQPKQQSHAEILAAYRECLLKGWRHIAQEYADLINNAVPDIAQPDSGRDAALVAAVTALAWKWHRDAVKDGFACSEPAQELFELLGWAADPGHPANVTQVGELSDAQIVRSYEAIKIWGHMTCDDNTSNRLLLEFARAIIAVGNSRLYFATAPEDKS